MADDGYTIACNGTQWHQITHTVQWSNQQWMVEVGLGPHTHNGGLALGQLALVPCMEAGASAAYMYLRLVRADSSGMVPDSELPQSSLQLCICGGTALHTP